MSDHQEEAKQIEKEAAVGPQIYKFLSLVSEGEDVTIRDDQYDFFWLQEGIKRCRKRGFRFRLIDSGRFTFSQLGWLANTGADIYTSAEVRPNTIELQFLTKTAQKSEAIVAYFCQGKLEESEKEDQNPSFSDLINLAASGAYLHLSNKLTKPDFSQLSLLAATCHQGGSWLVYYHHGSLEPALDELAASGAWIQLSDKSIQQEEEALFLLTIIKSARSAGANIILHLERELDVGLVQDVVKEGAFVLFKSFIPDFKSPYYPLAKEVRRKKLDFRSFYLYPHFLL